MASNKSKIMTSTIQPKIKKSSLSNELREKIKSYKLSKEDIERSDWKYIGSSRDSYLKIQTSLPSDFKIPPMQDECICGVPIIEQCYIYNIKTGDIEVLGTECIKKWTVHGKKRTCETCKKPHKNRKDNFCKDCRRLKRKILDVFDYIIPFGKYAGRYLADIYQIDEGYINWILKTFKSDDKIVQNINLMKNNWEKNPYKEKDYTKSHKITDYHLVEEISDILDSPEKYKFVCGDYRGLSIKNVVENKDNGMLYILDAYFNNEECLECGTPPKKSKCSDFQKILHKYVHLMEISHRRTIRDTLEKYKFVCGDYRGLSIENVVENKDDALMGIIYNSAFNKKECLECVTPLKKSKCSKFRKIAYSYFQNSFS